MKRGENKSTVLTLNGDLTVSCAAEVKSLLSDWISKHDEFQIDLAAVEAIDSSVIQLFIALKKSAAHTNKNITFVNHSREVLKIFDVYGLIGFFGDQLHMSADVKHELSLAYGLKELGGIHES